MRTSDVCPTCSTYVNALCVIYNGPYLSTLDVATGEDAESIIIKINGLFDNVAGLQNPDNINKFKPMRSFRVLRRLTNSQMATKINALPQFVIENDEIFYFKNFIRLIDPINPLLLRRRFLDADIYVLRDLGKGTYGVGGTQLTGANIRWLTSGTLRGQDVRDLDDTQFIDLFDVGTTDIVTAFNAHDFSVVSSEEPIQNQEDGYVLIDVIINGQALEYLFVGDGGLYGTGPGATETAIDDDFVLLTDLETLASTQFIELGSIGAGPIETGFNAHDFSVVPGEEPIQDQINGYVIVNTVIDGEYAQYLFVGAGGLYGTGPGGVETAISNDFIGYVPNESGGSDNDVWRDDAGVVSATAYTEDIRHDGNVAINKTNHIDARTKYNVEGGAAVTLDLSHADGTLNMGGASSALTVPPNATTPFPIGTQVRVIYNNPTGVLTYTPGGGVSITTEAGGLTRPGYSNCTLVKIGTDTWNLGDGALVVATPDLQAVADVGNITDTNLIVDDTGISWAHNGTLTPTSLNFHTQINGVHTADYNLNVSSAIVDGVYNIEFPNASGVIALLSDISGTPNLQAVTDIGNTTTLDIQALSFNDLPLFVQIGVSNTNIGIGSNALNSNTGSFVNAVGYQALFNNTQNNVNAFGYQALFDNIGTDSNGFGSTALRNNKGDYANGFGSGVLKFNLGNNPNGFGDEVLRYNQGDNNSAFGHNAFWVFTDDTANAKTVGTPSTDVDIILDRITLTSHGFGADGTYTHLKYTEDGTNIGGLFNLSIYTILIIDANTIEFYNNNITSTGGELDTHTFTPQFIYQNSTALGANSEPTKSNQVVLGDSATVIEVYSPLANYVGATFNDLQLFAQIGVDIHNIAIGVEAMGNGNTGVDSVAVGYRTLWGNSGSTATAVGHLAMSNTSAGSGNTAIGYAAFQSNSGTASLAVGKNAGRNNASDSCTYIGYAAGENSSGIYVTTLGHSAGASNSGAQSVLLGYTAGFNNSGTVATAVGYGAMYSNTAIESVGIGGFALQFNSGTRSTGIGQEAGNNNSGDNFSGLGWLTGENNVGDNVVSVGSNAMKWNVGNTSTGVGASSMLYNQGVDCSALGANSFGFIDNVAGDKDVADATTDIATGTERITITPHGFGANGTYVNLKYTTTGTPIGGLVHGSIYSFLIIDVNTIEFTGNITSVGTNIHTFTPGFAYTNTTVLGANAEPTASNQVVLGDASVTEVVMGNGDVIYDGIPHAYGSMYVTTGLTNTAAGTPAKLVGAGVTASNVLQNFTHTTPNRLTYTGTATARFKVSCALSCTHSVNSTIMTFSVAKTGTNLPNSGISRKVGTGGDVGALSLEWIVELAINDYIEIFSDSDSAGTTTVSKGNIDVIKL